MYGSFLNRISTVLYFTIIRRDCNKEYSTRNNQNISYYEKGKAA